MTKEIKVIKILKTDSRLKDRGTYYEMDESVTDPDKMEDYK